MNFKTMTVYDFNRPTLLLITECYGNEYPQKGKEITYIEPTLELKLQSEEIGKELDISSEIVLAVLQIIGVKSYGEGFKKLDKRNIKAIDYLLTGDEFVDFFIKVECSKLKWPRLRTELPTVLQELHRERLNKEIDKLFPGYEEYCLKINKELEGKILKFLFNLLIVFPFWACVLGLVYILTFNSFKDACSVSKNTRTNNNLETIECKRLNKYF